MLIPTVCTSSGERVWRSWRAARRLHGRGMTRRGGREREARGAAGRRKREAGSVAAPPSRDDAARWPAPPPCSSPPFFYPKIPGERGEEGESVPGFLMWVEPSRRARSHRRRLRAPWQALLERAEWCSPCVGKEVRVGEALQRRLSPWAARSRDGGLGPRVSWRGVRGKGGGRRRVSGVGQERGEVEGERKRRERRADRWVPPPRSGRSR
ncbi:hypothetical protein PVAP13_3KG266938 [Panicum virgatum]|uniref:Uncharacterized protein n=1 Tax=Panicum virgatum TaxID=38727 RepID=A0A8T0V0R4_PANVG|nr:hypothetical protein PVAP13_3KG266938 [Panicum virgatum]